MKTPDTVLILDCNALCYHAFYSMHGLSYRGMSTSVIFGFLSQVQTLCRTLQSAHLVFCWDSRQSLRKRIYPGYKDGRSQKDDTLLESFSQFNQLQREIIPRLGFKNNFACIGYEADDLIAALCKYPGPEDNQRYVIVSGDQDLYQLLTPQISMYKPNKKQLYTNQDFEQEYGIPSSLWADVKALAGCNTDSVPGIYGIGEKKAIAYLKNPGVPHKLIDTPESEWIVRRNRPLVTLPFAGTPPIKMRWDHMPSYMEWIAFCEELGFESFLEKPVDWEHIMTYQAPVDGLARMRLKSKMKGFDFNEKEK